MKRYKKVFKCVVKICLLLYLFSITGFCDNSLLKVSAATQNDAVNWAVSQLGKGLDYDGVYGNQCVDLIKYYYAYFGVAGYATGNANAYISNNLPPGWTRVYGNYQPGDVAVWKTNHSCSTCSTTGYGHVGIITSADNVGFNAVNQNFNGNSYCTQNWFNISALACAIRPAFVTDMSLTIDNVAEGDILYGTSRGIVGTVKNGGLYPWLELYMDYGYVDTTCNNEYGNYAFYLDTTKYNDGKHLLGVKIKNQNGLDFTLWRNIYINNSNSKSVSGQVGYTVKGIEDNKVISGDSVHISGSVMGGGKYPWLELYVDYGYVDTTCNNEYGNYLFCLDTTKYSNGDHRIGIKLKNQDGYDYTTWFLVKVNNQIDNDMEASEPSEKPRSTQIPISTSTPTPIPTLTSTKKPAASPTVKPTPQLSTGKNTVAQSKNDTYQKGISEPGITTIKSYKANKHGQVIFKWYNISSANGYQIQYSTKKNFINKKTKTVYSNNTVKLRLKSNKKYYVRIRAFKYENIQSKVYGKWSSKIKVKIRK